MTNNYKQEVEELLLKKQNRIKEQIIELKELTIPEALDSAVGRVSRMDAINNRSINESALRKKQVQLVQIEEALNEINDDDFGKCIKCGEPIPKERILLIPESKVCVNCVR